METPFQLTNNPDGNSSNAKWSPDNRWISFTSNRDGETQIYVINVNGGEAHQVTNSKVGISDFNWSPDGESIAYIVKEYGNQCSPEILCANPGCRIGKVPVVKYFDQA